MLTATFCTRDQDIILSDGDHLAVAVRRLNDARVLSMSDSMGNTYSKESEEVLRHPKHLFDAIGALEFWKASAVKVKKSLVRGEVLRELHVTIEFEGDPEPTLHFRKV